MKISSKINQSVFIMAILTLLIALFWAFLGVSRALIKTEKPVVTQKEISPLSGGLDNNIIKQLQERQ